MVLRSLPVVKPETSFMPPHPAGFLDEEDNGIESIEAQTQQGLKNLGKALNAAGASLDDVEKTIGLLRNSEDFQGG
jgi:enamine deaminase RidA (YjgF/YER057c/UK114 family)